MKRRYRTLLLSASLTMSLSCMTMPLLGAQSTPYKDVEENAWYMEGVQYMYEHQIMTGTSTDTFSPDQLLSRGMTATLLWRMEGSPAASQEGFMDVSQDAYYKKASDWAAQTGLMSGNRHADGTVTFNGADPVKRQDLALTLYRYNAYKNNEAGSLAVLEQYPDASSISPYAKEAMRWAVGQAILTGKSTGLDPLGYASRAQTATMLSRFLKMQNPAQDNQSPQAPDGQQPQRPDADHTTEEDKNMAQTIIATINNQEYELECENNAAAKALVNRLESGSLSVSVHPYGGFELVGPLDKSYPAQDRNQRANPGDVMLYLSDQIVFFYGSNSWSYTKLAHAKNVSAFCAALEKKPSVIELSLNQ